MSDQPQSEFPENHWPEIQRRAEAQGAEAVIAYIDGAEEDPQRLNLYEFARQALGQRDWSGKNLDVPAAVARAGIAAVMAFAQVVEDAERRTRVTDFANVMSFNLSADLAECWPGDELPRRREHFETGLEAAEDCLRWRRELAKGDSPMSMAHWARGMHLLSLQRPAEAVEDFEAACRHSHAAAQADGKSHAVEANGDFIVILNGGYAGIAQAAAGVAEGRERYEAACRAFAETDQAELKGDAQFGLDQLQVVGAKFLGR